MWSPDRYVDAARFAAERHQGQLWPGTELPYFVHLSMVAAEVGGALSRERFEDPDLAMQCALLHDSLEDTATTHEELVQRFGVAVAAGVLALTKDAAQPKAERMQDSLRRIRAAPREIWAVKLADRITNLQPPPAHWDPEKRRAYREEARLIHGALAAGSAWLGARLAEKIERYAEHLPSATAR